MLLSTCLPAPPSRLHPTHFIQWLIHSNSIFCSVLLASSPFIHCSLCSFKQLSTFLKCLPWTVFIGSVGFTCHINSTDCLLWDSADKLIHILLICMHKFKQPVFTLVQERKVCCKTWETYVRQQSVWRGNIYHASYCYYSKRDVLTFYCLYISLFFFSSSLMKVMLHFQCRTFDNVVMQYIITM